MYFPYLYARQQELLALRALADKLTSWDIVPILEPASLNPKDLVRCLEELARYNATCFLVVNPSVHGFPNPAPSWFAAVAPYLAPQGPAMPMHQIATAAEAQALGGFLSTYAGVRTAVSLRSASIAPSALAGTLSGQSTIAFVHDGVNHTSYLQALPATQGVHVGHRFNVKPRNADYVGDEWFTDAHRTYLAEGRPGYSDFGPLPPTFTERGGQASAVAIHLTYLAEDGDIWIEHFVSDNVTYGLGSPASKLAEATAKVARRVAVDPTKFVRSLGLEMYLTQDRNQAPTNLPGSKRQQLMHHLHTTAVARPGAAGIAALAPAAPRP